MDVMWSSLAWPGLEHVRWTEGDGPHADGLAVHELPGGPARVAYRLTADEGGRTRRLSVEVGGRALVIAGDGRGAWTDAGGRPLPGLSGCVDVDISTTPLTNTLPIRRLGLAPGAAADLLVVYVDVPDLEPRAVTQRYTCLGRSGAVTVYRYESGSFRADITVDDHGLVVDYPGLWRRSR
ncbi:putative glycolipid-binding domain-containing protein [Nonomuraea terrae]|uniref:putative glycolipid-binding domain-containing protein n=1 Tax=Nonomuraea terrae TaxID=2530383 RepID=UPI0037ABA90C